MGFAEPSLRERGINRLRIAAVEDPLDEGARLADIAAISDLVAAARKD